MKPSIPVMPAKTFVDTNILVYAHDVEAGLKRIRAAEIVKELWTERRGVLSLQVLQEFYVTLTQKVTRPLPPKAALELVRQYGMWEVVKVGFEDLIQAVRLQQRYRFSFWDAMILQAALMSDCSVLLSEDMNDQQQVEGVLIQNPLHPPFCKTEKPGGTSNRRLGRHL